MPSGDPWPVHDPFARAAVVHAAANDPNDELLHAACEESEIPFTIQASARYTGTDADAVHISRGGIPTGVVSIPLRYMHSPVEMVQMDDVENTAKLIAAFAHKLSAGLSFLR